VLTLDAHGRAAVADLMARELVELTAERLVLTRQGRLLADAVVRDLLP
jgi:coproporphyrinogen III oxidase-like Fe-S oxidoreductase